MRLDFLKIPNEPIGINPLLLDARMIKLKTKGRYMLHHTMTKTVSAGQTTPTEVSIAPLAIERGGNKPVPESLASTRHLLQG